MRKTFASNDVEMALKVNKLNKINIYSFFPIDQANCDCQKLIQEWKVKFGTASEADRQRMRQETPFLKCPKDKTAMKRYQIVCQYCKQVQGYCWATDKTLSNWCDFHYVQWTEGVDWKGCFTPHISPITEQLCFECCCGQDTRDFRANMTMGQKEAERIESQNKVGRNLGQSNSKFKAIEFSNIVVG